jgi:hypothetical protein
MSFLSVTNSITLDNTPGNISLEYNISDYWYVLFHIQQHFFMNSINMSIKTVVHLKCLIAHHINSNFESFRDSFIADDHIVDMKRAVYVGGVFDKLFQREMHLPKEVPTIFCMKISFSKFL